MANVRLNTPAGVGAPTSQEKLEEEVKLELDELVYSSDDVEIRERRSELNRRSREKTIRPVKEQMKFRLMGNTRYIGGDKIVPSENGMAIGTSLAIILPSLFAMTFS